MNVAWLPVIAPKTVYCGRLIGVTDSQRTCSSGLRMRARRNQPVDTRLTLLLVIFTWTIGVSPSLAGIGAPGGPNEHPPPPPRQQAGANLTRVQLAQLLARLLESGEPVPGVGTVLWVGQPYRPGSVAAFGVAPDGSLVWMLEEWRESGTDRFQVIRWWFSVHPARVRDDRILPIDTEREGALHRGNIVETIRGRKRVPLTAEAVSKFTQAWGFLTGSPCDHGIAGR